MNFNNYLLTVYLYCQKNYFIKGLLPPEATGDLGEYSGLGGV